MPTGISLGKLLGRLANSRAAPRFFGAHFVGSTGRLGSRWAVFHCRTPRQSAGTFLAKLMGRVDVCGFQEHCLFNPVGR